MLLCIDIGNTQLHGGVYDGEVLKGQFRKSTQPLGSTDEMGIFFVSVLRENGIDPRSVDRIALCSVVPAALHPVRGACHQYFGAEPFVLQAGVKTGLKIRYRNPLEVGADRIAGAVAASFLHRSQNIIIVDCGTATTFDVVTSGAEYLGGVILPGIGVSAEALASRTAKLPRVEIARPESVLGRSTIESIQSGLYHGHTGAIRHIVGELSREVFAGVRPVVVGTGGFARMLESEHLFDSVVPELVLLGLRQADALNRAHDAGA